MERTFTLPALAVTESTSIRESWRLEVAVELSHEVPWTYIVHKLANVFYEADEKAVRNDEHGLRAREIIGISHNDARYGQLHWLSPSTYSATLDRTTFT